MLIYVLIALAVLFAGIPTADAQHRVALVVGNGAYERGTPLVNPANDARAVGTLLRAVGFEVVESIDEPRGKFAATMRKFIKLSENSDVAFFHYGGHGVQIDGKNYLVPVDAELETADDVKLQGVDVDLVLNSLGRSRVRILVLDACRDNPFAQQMARDAKAKDRANPARSGAGRVGVGLAEISAQDNSFIAFATSPGAVAYDGAGQPHSPLTAALIEHLTTPGQSIDAAFTRVRAEVRRRTNGLQLPWTNSSLVFSLYLASPEPLQKPGEQGAGDAPSTRQKLEVLEYEFWKEAERSGGVLWYKAYLERYPQGTFAEIARLKIAAIGARTEPPVGGPPPSQVDGSPIHALHVPPSDAAIRAADVSAATESALELTSADWARVQSVLGSLGFAGVNPDGRAGEKTRDAIRAWQKRRAFPGKGYLNRMQLDALLKEIGFVEAYQHDPRQPRPAGSTASRASDPSRQPAERSPAGLGAGVGVGAW